MRTTLLCVAGLVLGLLTVPGVATAAPDLETYRVLNYNVDMPGDLGGFESRYGTRNTERVESIAERIIDGDYDVVALSEVVDVDTREAFRTELALEYPFSVPDVGDEDLMLFSRFPFSGAHVANGECVKFNPANQCLVAFHEYSAGDGGIGFVQLGNPRSDRPTQVYFTGLQTGDDFAVKQIRAAQVAEATSFIGTWSKKTPMFPDVILAGELNIKAGSGEHLDLVTNGFGGVGLTDTWGTSAPSLDPGFTVDSDLNAVAGADGTERRDRTDYVLFRHSVETRACVQHATLERHFIDTYFNLEPAPGGTTSIVDLSDHFPVAVNIGKQQAHCSVLSTTSPEPAKPSPASEVWETMGITRRGGFQWVRYTVPGTYTFQVQLPTQQNMVLDVFDATDMSTPLKPVTGDSILVTAPCSHIEECKATTPVTVDTTGPFFVRLRMQNPSHTGSYKFYSRLHRGASFTDAIYLNPFESMAQTQMTAAVKPLDTVHYRFTQHALDSGLPQRLTFKADQAQSPLRISLYKMFDINLPAPPPDLVSGMSKPKVILDVPAQGSPIDGAEQDLFFTVDRGDCLGPCPPPTNYTVQYTTSLRNLDVRRLVVLTQNDDPAPDLDEIRCEFWVDFATSLDMDFGSMDEGDSHKFEDPFRDINFDTEVQFECIELDNSEATNDTTLTQKILPSEIPPTSTVKVKRVLPVYVDGDQTDPDGEYRIHYTGKG